MRNTQRILYKIGKIVNFVLLGVYGLIIVLNLIFLIVNAANDREFVSNISNMVTWTIFLGLLIALIILVGIFSEEALHSTPDNLKAVIILMVFGLLSLNELFLVGGIFGIIAASQEANANEPKKVEEKDDKAE